ncbi:MAG TPA: NAD-dependent epimerase/dehydratase family protein, partial [Bryobacteraceae bacterium]|nr:NAD-dependent epimerase/dehydratase family protein [Bryobacteraceae bacterium]
MRVVVIGGTGHIGSYLVPQLIDAGHRVVCVSRGRRDPYFPHAAWQQVQMETMDRQAEESAGSFGRRIAELKPEALLDITCYTPESARQLVDGFGGTSTRLLHCGTIWVHGSNTVVPTTEDLPRRPLEEYGKRKATIEAYLLDQTSRGAIQAAVLHPGHIVGEGWPPLNPQGHFSPWVFERLARGEALALPHLGLETFHHVHAGDVAQGFVRALENWDRAAGESFHIVSEAALTQRGYAEAVASWFGKEAKLTFLPWEEWRR